MLAEFLVHARALLPPEGTTIVVAVSGGADSIALLELLAIVRAWPLVVYHLDHALRDASVGDAEFVRASVLAHQASGVDCRAVIERADIVELAGSWRCGIEAAGRRHRYERLRKVAKDARAGAVVTAHHRDDQAETVLMHLLRGAGSAGGAGMLASRDLEGVPLVRPLLEFSRQQLRAYLDGRGVPWREDASNHDDRFRRNHVRMAVLPLLELAVPGTVDALLRWTQADGQRRAGMPSGGGGSGSSGERWRALLVDLGIGPTRQRIDRLAELEHGAIGRRLRLGDWLFERVRDSVRWEREGGAPCSDVIAIDGPGTYRRGEQTLELQAAPVPVDPRVGTGEAWLDSACIRWPMAWRPWRPEDAWRPLGAPGRQGVRKYLSDHKADARSRAGIAVLADAEGVLWIPGYCVAERVRIGTTTAYCVHGFVAPAAPVVPVT